MQDNAIRVLQPKISVAFAAGSITDPSLAIGAGKIGQVIEVVDLTRRINGRGANPIKPRPQQEAQKGCFWL